MKLLFGALAIACAACSSVNLNPDAAEYPLPAEAAAGVVGSDSLCEMRVLADCFPDAAMLGTNELMTAIVGRRFNYRLIGTDGTDLVVVRPKEVFRANGQYEVHGRAISYCTYSIETSIVSIDCHQTFLGLGRERVFFRNEGRLFTANANGEGSVVELIPLP